MSRTVVLDEYGHCINQLTQWDLNRTIVIDDYEYDTAPVVHFCNRSSNEALPVESELSDKKVTAKIPNILLERTDTILVYICLCDSDKNVLETINYFELPIRRRPKPKDYVYVQNTDYIRILDLKNELEKFKNNSEESFRGIEAEFDNIKSNINTIINDVNSAKNNANKAAESANQIKATIEEALSNGLFNGADGTSIVGAQIIENDLIVSLSNGETINTGKVKYDAKAYGVCYDFKSKNPKLTRIGDAKYLKAEIANGKDDTDVVNDFDKIYPWSDIKRCTVAKDGTITSYEGDPNYIEDGSIGEVETEIPEHYRMIYVDETTGKEYRYVSREKLNEHYKFVPKTYIGSFLMTSNADGIGESRAGTAYYRDTYSLSQAQAATKARGSGWHQFDIWEYETIKTLFMIEFATLDSQSIYPGNDRVYFPQIATYPNEECAISSFDETVIITDTEFTTNYFVTDNTSYNIGDKVEITVVRNDNPEELDYDCDGEYYAVREIIRIEPADTEKYPDLEDGMSLFYFSGAPITMEKEITTCLSFGWNGEGNETRNVASSSKIPCAGFENFGFVYRSIENFLSVDYTWIDGVLLHNSQYWVCKDSDKYATTIYAYDANGNVTEDYQYQPLSFGHPGTAGYITKMGYDEETGLTLPVETGGSSDLGYCDQFTKPRNTTGIYSVRTGNSDSATSGLFYLSCPLTATNVNHYAARLSYRHY